jgi:predicted MPP superfamily phosphohydrolase
VLLGDFVSTPVVGRKKPAAKKAEPCAQVLSGLRARLGTYAVLGNHDCATDGDFVAEALAGHGISVLRDSSRVFEQNGARLSLLGLNDAIQASPNLERVLTTVSAEDPKILLVHEPDFADHSSRFDIDVQFSGHSHGGQVRIPGIHPLWLPPLAHKYYKGYYRVRDTHLYTNEGIGTIGVPFRFFSPPEVTLVTLRS